MNHKYISLPMILLCVFGAAACQTTAVNHASSKISYADLTPQARQLAESTTKCALAMLVLNSENYSSINEVYFDSGDTYGELMSVLDDGAQKKLIGNVALRANKYAALHYDGVVFPVMLEYVFDQGCNYLYFSSDFNVKYSDLIETLGKLEQ